MIAASELRGKSEVHPHQGFVAPVAGAAVRSPGFAIRLLAKSRRFKRCRGRPTPKNAPRFFCIIAFLAVGSVAVGWWLTISSPQTLPLFSLPSLPLFDSWHYWLCAATFGSVEKFFAIIPSCFLVFNALFWLHFKVAIGALFYFIYIFLYLHFTLPPTGTGVRLIKEERSEERALSPSLAGGLYQFLRFAAWCHLHLYAPSIKTSSDRKCAAYSYILSLPTFQVRAVDLTWRKPCVKSATRNKQRGTTIKEG